MVLGKQSESGPGKSCWYHNLLVEGIRPLLPKQQKKKLHSVVFFANACKKYLFISSHFETIKIQRIW